jgi:hypothetical protein
MIADVLPPLIAIQTKQKQLFNFVSVSFSRLSAALKESPVCGFGADVARVFAHVCVLFVREREILVFYPAGTISGRYFQ